MTQTAHEPEGQSPHKPKRKRGLIKKALITFSILLGLSLIIGCGFIYWICQSESGQAWLQEIANSALAPKNGTPGYQITTLSGSLPFDFTFGLHCIDKDGIWLDAPSNHFKLNWHELPKTLHISVLEIKNASLKHIPSFPPSPEPKTPDKPFSITELKEQLTKLTDFLGKKHWWLPDIKVDGVSVSGFLLPAELLPQNGENIKLDSTLLLSLISNVANGHLTFNLANNNSQDIKLNNFSFNNLEGALAFSLTPTTNTLTAKSGINFHIEKPLLKSTYLPEDYFGQSIELALNLDALANTSADSSLAIDFKGPDLSADKIRLTGNGSWKSGNGWSEGKIDGPVAILLAATANPAESKNPIVDILKKPANLQIGLSGNFPEIAVKLDLECAEAKYENYNLTNTKLALASSKIAIPLSDKEWALLEKEHQLEINLASTINEEKITFHTQSYFQAISTPVSNNLAHPVERLWKTGVRDLKLEALGIEANGEIASLISSGSQPALDGKLAISARKWDTINKLLPDQSISGNIAINLDLDSGLPLSEPGNLLEAADFLSGKFTQKVALSLISNQFSLKPEKGKPIGIKGLELKGEANNPFSDLRFNASLRADKIMAEGMNLSARAKTGGALKGPIEVELATAGSIQTKVSANWRPGLVHIDAFNIQMNSAQLPSSPKNLKGIMLGAKMTSPAEVTYGDKGLAVKNLNLALLPSGQLRANGGLAPDKLDLNLGLENLDFKPWQSIVPQLPTGSANLKVNLSGSPSRPGGVFRLGVAGLQIPGAQLAPISFNLHGAIENAGSASALSLRLNLDPKTLQTLGGSVANITAKIPLQFASNGIPSPKLDGPLTASIRWDGALGPIWNLVPVADQRLNGRFGINIKAGGTLKAPRIEGGISIDKGRYENILYGVLLTEINMRLNLTENRAISSLKNDASALPGSMALTLNMTDGRGGTVAVNGKGNLDGSDLDITAKINRLKPLRRRDIHIELSGDVLVKGNATSPDITGAITVNRGEILLDNLDIASTSVTTLPITEPDAKKKESIQKKSTPPAQTGHLNIRIIIPPRFSVEGRGLGSIWQANLLIEGSLTDPQITGTINAYSGNFDFLGKNFALTKGMVTFAGGSLANPLLNIELTNETPDLTAHIMITGPVNKMRLTLTSDPNLPRDDILSRVLFGKSVNDLSRLEALQLAGAVAQLAGFGSGGGILSSAKKALGVDVLRIGTSSSSAAGDGDEGAGGTNIEMGKYINDMIYMGVQQGLQQDSTAFIIQLELSPRTSLELRTEDNNTWGGLNWKYNY